MAFIPGGGIGQQTNLPPATHHRFIEEGAFFWSRRSDLASALVSGLGEFERLDRKLEAAIDLMLLNPDSSQAICMELIEEDTSGSFSMAASLAILSNNRKLLDRLIAMADAEEERQRELATALAWLPFNEVRDLIRSRLLFENSSPIRQASIRALRQHRQLPEQIPWERLFTDAPESRSDIIRLIGEKHLIEYRPALEHLLNTDPACATWALCLLGAGVELRPLLDGMREGSFPAPLGLPIALGLMNAEEQESWIDRLISHPETLALAIEAIGISGRPNGVERLFESYASSRSLRVRKQVAHAYSRITGYYPKMEKKGSTVEPAETGDAASFEEDADEELLSVTPIDFLERPDFEKMKAWWQNNRQRFEPGQAYRLGQPLTPPHRRQQLVTGPQDIRGIAALEIARTGHGPVFPVRAQVWRQYAMLKEYVPEVEATSF